jgi:vacuolar-type H+-ATPase subunit B/Vma2
VKFGNEFERHLVDQRPSERRDLEDTLDRCWLVAHTLPTRELTMLSAQLLAAHPKEDR